MYPWEVRNSPADKSILIFPGAGMLRLPRFTYYSDPILGRWARPDPNKPAPKVEPLPMRPVATANIARPESRSSNPAALLQYAWIALALLAVIFAYEWTTKTNAMGFLLLAIVSAGVAWMLHRKYS